MNMFSPTSGIQTPLIDFNMLFDLDFALICLISQKYLDKDVFNVEWFKSNDTVIKLVRALYNREEINPLYECANDSISREELDSLYKEFMSDKKARSEMKDTLMYTELYKAVGMFRLSGDIDTSILYTNEFEKEILESFDVTSGCQLYSIMDLTEYDYKRKFNQYYLKYIEGPLADNLSDILFEKTIYIPDYKFNLTIDEELEAYVPIVRENPNTKNMEFNNNVIRIMNLYDRNQLYVPEEVNEDD